MRDWKKVQRTLTQAEVNELMRDAAVLEGLADEGEDPGGFVERKIRDLGFDDPPLPSEPDLEREAYYYYLMTLFKKTNNRLSKHHFSFTSWMDAGDSTKLRTFATVIFNKHYREEDEA